MTTLQNKNICITGGLRKMERCTAYDMIRLEGGVPKDNMSGIVDVLVIADSKRSTATGKKTKAEQMGISVIYEDEFYELIGA